MPRARDEQYTLPQILILPSPSTTAPASGSLPPGHLAHKKQRLPRPLQLKYAKGPVVVLGGWAFRMSEVPLKGIHVYQMSLFIVFAQGSGWDD